MSKPTGRDRDPVAAGRDALHRRAHWHGAAMNDPSQQRVKDGHRNLSQAAARHAETLEHFDPAGTASPQDLAALRLAAEVLEWEAVRWREEAVAASTEADRAGSVAKAREAHQQADELRELQRRLNPDRDSQRPECEVER